MKVVTRVIYSFQEKDFFAPIRDKIEYARVVVLAARQLLLDMDDDNIETVSSMRLVVDKMSRLFFYKEKKYFSISFPFTILLDGDNIAKLTSYTGKNLDNKSISAVISILDNEQFRLNPSLIDFYIEPNSIDSIGLFLLEEIFQSEPSYVRYDYDPDNENGKLHPLNHLDINYSQYSTFKLGFNQEIDQAYFENLQNIKTDCSFIVD